MCRILSTALVAACVFAVLPACEQEPPEADELRALVARIDAANQNADGATATASFTEGSIARYARRMELALNGKRKDVEALDAWDMSEVLRMRVRARRNDIEGLDPRAYVAFATSQGWYVQDESLQTELRSIRVSGDTAYATARYTDEYGGEYESEMLTFRREDGVWKLDEDSWRGTFNRLTAERAADEGVSIAEALLMMIEEETGKPNPITVWSPMR
ncbi:MAG: hypothetical protein ACKVU4_12165 [Phycisphaerales bacterium]